jgi:CubicO group peptidase (beta-lactamase class C family)
MEIFRGDRTENVIKVFLLVFIAIYCLPYSKVLADTNDYTETDFTKRNPLIISDCEKLIKDGLDKSNIVGMSVAIVDENNILWAKGYGFTDKDKKNKVNADTIFSLQSISKTITSTAVMKAVQQGILDLDKPIIYYLPDFKVNSAFEVEPEKKITLRHLLSHTAGFTHEAPVGSNYDPSSPSFEEHIKSIQSTWLKFPVGENYSYSNLGIDLAAYILQKQSGKPFYQYFDENIAKPIGMINSSFDMNRIKSNKNRAVGHSSLYFKMPIDIPIIPSGGFYSSATDLAKFVQMHINSGTDNNQSIISSKYLDEMYNIPFPLYGQTEGYALGIMKGKYYNTYMLNHNGGGFGFLTSMSWLPELKIGVVVLSNTVTLSDAASLPGYISSRILDRIVKDYSTIYYSRLRDIKTEGITTSNVNSYTLQLNLVSNVTSRLSQIKFGRNPNVSNYKKYTGNYFYTMYGIPFAVDRVNIYIKDNNLYANNDILTEVKEGLFYNNSGEVYDFSKVNPTFRNIKLKKLHFGLSWYVIFLGTYTLALISLPFLALHKRDNTDNNAKFKKQRLFKALLGLNAIAFVVYAVGIYFVLSSNILVSQSASKAAYVQVEHLISIFKYVSVLVMILLPLNVILNILLWKNKCWSRVEKVHYSVISVFCVLFTILLHYFNLILI